VIGLNRAGLKRAGPSRARAGPGRAARLDIYTCVYTHGWSRAFYLKEAAIAK
jgi:hypothetical protein